MIVATKYDEITGYAEQLLNAKYNNFIIVVEVLLTPKNSFNK